MLDLRGRRDGDVSGGEPNTNVCHPRTRIPTLIGEHEPGTHWLATAVMAARPGGDDRWERPPELSSVPADADVDSGAEPLVITDVDGAELLRCEPGDPAAE